VRLYQHRSTDEEPPAVEEEPKLPPPRGTRAEAVEVVKALGRPDFDPGDPVAERTELLRLRGLGDGPRVDPAAGELDEFGHPKGGT
jgi:hypothetical protein